MVYMNELFITLLLEPLFQNVAQTISDILIARHPPNLVRAFNQISLRLLDGLLQPDTLRTRVFLSFFYLCFFFGELTEIAQNWEYVIRNLGNEIVGAAAHAPNDFVKLMNSFIQKGTWSRYNCTTSK